MRTYLSILLVVTAILGFADASYLTYEKLAGVIPQCGESFDCGSVVNSKYGSVGPIPVSAFGMLYYASVFILAALYMTEVSASEILKRAPFAARLPKDIQNIQTEDLLLLLTAIGVVVSVVLVSLMAFVLEAWCPYCLVSAGSSTILFIGSIVALSKNRENSYLIKILSRGN